MHKLNKNKGMYLRVSARVRAAYPECLSAAGFVDDDSSGEVPQHVGAHGLDSIQVLSLVQEHLYDQLPACRVQRVLVSWLYSHQIIVYN